MIPQPALIALVDPVAGQPVAAALAEDLATDRRVVRPRRLAAAGARWGPRLLPLCTSPHDRAHPNHCAHCAETFLEFLRDDPVRQVCGLLGNNKDVGLDGHWEDRLLPLVHCEKLVDVGVELGKDRVEVRDFLVEKGNEDGGVVIEGVGPHLVKRLAKVFIGP